MRTIRLEAPPTNFLEKGFTVLEDVIEEDRLHAVEQTLIRLMVAASSRLPTDQRRIFDEQEFDDDELLHEGLLLLDDLAPELAQLVIDGASSSHSIYNLALDPELTDRLVEVTGAHDSTDLGASGIAIRIDYPSIRQDRTRKIELPYHQDSAYYPRNVSTSTGWVAWIPLFDCGPEDGSLRIRVGSHRHGLVEHEGYFVDPVRERHWRVRLPEEVVALHQEQALFVPRGGVALQHFHLFHASGPNQRTNRVRYTILVRGCQLTAPDFRAASW